MSKSESDKGTIYLLDPIEISKKKIMKALTDSENKFYYDPENKPGVSNLLSIYSCFSGKTIEQAEAEFDGKGYGDFKTKVAEAVIEGVAPIQEEQQRIVKDKAYLEEVLKDGAYRASKLAYKTLDKVYRKVGFIPRVR